jgi:hypothetical protein
MSRKRASVVPARLRFLTALVGLPLLALLGLGVAHAQQGEAIPGMWSIQVIPDTVPANRITGMGFYNDHCYCGTQEYPTVGYSDSDNNLVKAAMWDGAAWRIYQVDRTRSGAGIDVACDPKDGKASMTYGWGKLSYAHWTGVRWAIQTVDSGNCPNDQTALVFDPRDGYPSVAFTRFKTGLRFAHWSGKAWGAQTVAAGSDGRWKALAFSPTTLIPSIAYSADLNDDARYDTVMLTSQSGSSWSTPQPVVTGGVLLSLAFEPPADGADHPVVAYSGNSGVGLARWNGSTWDYDPIDAGHGASVAVDSFGRPWVAYTYYNVAGEAELRVAWRDGATWVIEAVDPGNSSTGGAQLILDPDGRPSVSYGDSATGLARLARRTELPPLMP